LLLLLIAALLPLGACGEERPFDPLDPVVGSYALVQVNGSDLPVLVAEDARGQVRVTDGRLILRSDQTFTATMVFRLSSGPLSILQSQREDGTFKVVGETIEFHDDDGDTSVAQLNGTRVSGHVSGYAVTYQKQ
jgi:hypothetical protein